MTDTKTAKMLEKIRGLLAKADGTEFPAEADAFRAKADQLMTAYTIEAWQVEAAQDGVNKRPEPIARDMDITWFRTSPLKDQLWSLMLTTAQHCRVALVAHRPQWGRDSVTLPAVGLPADLDYFDMLFTSLMLQLGKQLEPKMNDRLTLEENVKRFKEAGMKWGRIAELIGRTDLIDPDGKVKDGGLLIRLYKRQCKLDGTTPMAVNPSVYQRNFAGGFVAGVRGQLHLQSEAQSGSDASTALVLRDIREVVQDAVNDLYGKDNRRLSRRQDNRKVDWAARAAGTDAGMKANVAGHTSRRVGNQKELGKG